MDQRVMNEDKGGLALLKLRFEPVQLLFPERADAGIEVRRGAVLRAAQEVTEVDEAETFIVQT